MRVRHIGTACAFMQIVHVLRDHHELGDILRQCCDGEMGRIGLRAQYLHAPPFIPAPNQFPVFMKSVGRGKVLRIESFPQTGERIAKGGDAAFSRHPGACENNYMPGAAQGVYHGLREGNRWVQVHCAFGIIVKLTVSRPVRRTMPYTFTPLRPRHILTPCPAE